jgi:hypothetical protein
MLNACAAGVAVVNIDNGYGAGVLAHRINRMASAPAVANGRRPDRARWVAPHPQRVR